MLPLSRLSKAARYCSADLSQGHNVMRMVLAAHSTFRIFSLGEPRIQRRTNFLMRMFEWSSHLAVAYDDVTRAHFFSYRGFCYASNTTNTRGNQSDQDHQALLPPLW